MKKKHTTIHFVTALGRSHPQTKCGRETMGVCASRHWRVVTCKVCLAMLQRRAA